MKNLGLPYLINTKIYSISQLLFKESNGIEFNMSDTFILESSKGLLQILNDYNKIYIFSIASVKSAKILGDFETDQAEIYLNNTKEVANGGAIQSIHNYTQASTYFFGSKFLDNNEAFVLGFCYGFDEIVCLSEPEFESLLSNYYSNSNVNVNVNVITPS